jgi:hypothetical protein
MVSDPAVNPVIEPPIKPLAKRGIVRRVFAGAVFLPLFIFVTRRGGYFFLGFVDLFIILGLFEFYRMMAVKGMRPYRGIGIASGLTLSTYMYFRSGLYGNFFLTFVLIAIMGLELTARRARVRCITWPPPSSASSTLRTWARTSCCCVSCHG